MPSRLKGITKFIDEGGYIPNSIIINFSSPNDDLKLELFEMSIYFDERLKAKEKLEQDHLNQGQKWSAEEDEQLLAEFNEGKSVKEMSALHQRNIGAIRSRLSKLGVQL